MSSARQWIFDVVHPLGLQERRTDIIVGMARHVARGAHPHDAPGVGAYARDSVDLFVFGTIPIGVFDKELSKYVLWRREGGWPPFVRRCRPE